MEDIFVQKIHINKVRHLENVDIEINENERKHLILTGKNGSGKTSLLEGVRDFLKAVENTHFSYLDNWLKGIEDLNKEIKRLKNELMNLHIGSQQHNSISQQIKVYEQNINSTQSNISQYKGKIDLAIKNVFEIVEKYQKGNFILTFFPAQRIFKPIIPTNVEKINPPQTSKLDEKTNPTFIKYLVDLDYKSSRAYKDKDQTTIQEIENWFSTFSSFLKTIFGDDSLEMKFYESEKGYNFQIYTKDREPFDLTTLSDGYASILNIVTELILRMENKQAKNYDIQGIVLIDEIETHLHIDLQKKILPFLTTFFPKIQFIVTTHSPFVLNSISNAVIYDLENHQYLADVSDISASALVEHHFQVKSEYSEVIKDKLLGYETLVLKEELTTDEAGKLADLEIELSELSPLLSPEMYLKYHELQKKLSELV